MAAKISHELVVVAAVVLACACAASVFKYWPPSEVAAEKMLEITLPKVVSLLVGVATSDGFGDVPYAPAMSVKLEKASSINIF